jgi:hypothetical protein
MPKQAGLFRIVKVRGHHVEHIVGCDESGGPRDVTLCKLKYDSMKRSGSKPIESKTGKECEKCLTRFGILTLGSLRTPKSHPQGLRVHLTEDRYRPVCGQDCYDAETLTLDIRKVTCQKCIG